MGLVHASDLQEWVHQIIKEENCTLAEAMYTQGARYKFRGDDEMEDLLGSAKYFGSICRMRLPKLIDESFSKEGVTVGSVEASLVKAGYPKEYVALYIVDYLKNQYLV